MTRSPFLLSCACLYACLAAPLRLTFALNVASSPTAAAAAACITLGWMGWAIAAAGDLQKTVTKAMKGESHLVVGGIFRWLRHPN